MTRNRTVPWDSLYGVSTVQPGEGGKSKGKGRSRYTRRPRICRDKNCNRGQKQGTRPRLNATPTIPHARKCSYPSLHRKITSRSRKVKTGLSGSQRHRMNQAWDFSSGQNRRNGAIEKTCTDRRELGFSRRGPVGGHVGSGGPHGSQPKGREIWPSRSLKAYTPEGEEAP